LALLGTLITFETGDKSQADGNGEVGATMTVGAYPHEGSYGAQCDVNQTSDTNFQAYIYRSYAFPAGNKVWAKFWIQEVAFTQAGYGVAGSKAYVAITDNTGYPMFWILITDSGGGHLGLEGLGLGRDGNPMWIGGTAFADGNYHAIKLLVDKSGTVPYIEWWFDGVSQGSGTDTSAGTDGLAKTPGRAYYGIVHIVNWEKGVYTFNIDDCGAYDADPDASTLLPRLALLGVG
jgi:hypothetical protein